MHAPTFHCQIWGKPWWGRDSSSSAGISSPGSSHTSLGSLGFFATSLAPFKKVLKIVSICFDNNDLKDCLFFFCSIGAKGSKTQQTPRTVFVPSPNVSCVFSGCCNLLAPSLLASTARKSATTTQPFQLLRAIVSIACSNLLRSRCLRACSSFSKAAKI